MRKLSLEHVFGCSTVHRHSLIGLPDNRLAFIAGCYLVILDCSTHEQRYLCFSAIEFLYVSPHGTIMSVIDRATPETDTRIHLFSTHPIDQLSVIEPDRFGRFVSMAINDEETLLMILHAEPGYMLTIRKNWFFTEKETIGETFFCILEEIHLESDEQHVLTMVDLASVRLVHGPVINRMTKQEVTPHVAFISFCPSEMARFCVTGAAIFKIFEIEDQNMHQQLIHFRAEFYSFTCHCWLDPNSILVSHFQ